MRRVSFFLWEISLLKQRKGKEVKWCTKEGGRERERERERRVVPSLCCVGAVICLYWNSTVPWPTFLSWGLTVKEKLGHSRLWLMALVFAQYVVQGKTQHSVCCAIVSTLLSHNYRLYSLSLSCSLPLSLSLLLFLALSFPFPCVL